MSDAQFAEFVGRPCEWTPVDGEPQPALIRDMTELEPPSGEPRKRILVDPEGRAPVETDASRVEVVG